MSGFAQIFGDEKPQTPPGPNETPVAATPPTTFSVLFADNKKSPTPTPVTPVTPATAGPTIRSAVTGTPSNPVDEFAKNAFKQLSNGQADDTTDLREMLKAHGYSEADINEASVRGLTPRMAAGEEEIRMDFLSTMKSIWNHPNFNRPIIPVGVAAKAITNAGIALDHAMGADKAAVFDENVVKPVVDKLGDFAGDFTSAKALTEMLALGGVSKWGRAGKAILALIGIGTATHGAREIGAGLGHLSAEVPGSPESKAAVEQTTGGVATTTLGAAITVPGVIGAMEGRANLAAVRSTKAIGEHTLANGGGTFDLAAKGGKPLEANEGYIVGKVSGNYSAPIEPDDTAALHSTLAQLKTEHPNTLAGTWVNEDGKIIVDPVEVVKDKFDALRLGAARGQQAIFDAKAKQVVNVPEEFKAAYGPGSENLPVGATTQSGLKLPVTTFKGLLTGANPETPAPLKVADVAKLSSDELMSTFNSGSRASLTSEAYRMGAAMTPEERPQLESALAQSRENFNKDMNEVKHSTGQAKDDALNRLSSSGTAPQFYREALEMHDALQKMNNGATADVALKGLSVGKNDLLAAFNNQDFSGRWLSGTTPEALFNSMAEHETPKALATLPPADGSTGGLPPHESVFNTGNMPPNSDPVQWPASTLAQRLGAWWERQWPRDAAMIKARPETYALSGFQAYRTRLLGALQDFADRDWYKDLRKLSPEQFVEDEHTAMYTYKQERANGVAAKTAFETAMSKIHPETAQYFRYRQQVAPIVQDAMTRLGQQPFDLVDGPYAPRLTTEQFDNVVNVRNGGSSFANALRTTVGGFANSREHLTMKDGLASGTQYVDPVRAVWLRELTDAKVVETARMVDEYKERGVLFPTEEAARAASPEGSEPWKVRNLAGGDYWTATKEEAQWLDQNMKQSGRGEFGRMNLIANALARNPNLVNPLPHATKNMFFKYVLGRVREFNLRSSADELSQPVPGDFRARFEDVMSMGQGNTTISQMNASQIGTFTDKALAMGLKANALSTRFTFNVADPALRFSLWKSYVNGGMTDQQAANHVWLDLVRYDVRSGAVDFWKSVPFNFFTAWRVGSVVSLAKSATAHPIRTAMFIGAVDYLREMRYRATGRWTHMPHDYVEGPISTLKDDPMALPSVVATTALLGPGGSQAPSLITDAMKIVQGDPQVMGRLKNTMWGLSQLYEVPREYNAYERTGDASHLENILTAAALAEHSSLNYSPRRLASVLPEWMPGMQKSQIVQQAERMQAMRDANRARQNARGNKPLLPDINSTTEEDQLAQVARGARR
jgi:hypothetical protein